jgi:trehalose utilization protein
MKKIKKTVSLAFGRRRFLKTATLAAVSVVAPRSLVSAAPIRTKNVRVVVWDERQPSQKEAYENFLGNEIAQYLQKQSGIEVKSVALDDPGQGLSDEVLDGCDVLIWWGHKRQPEVLPETGKKIVARISSGALSLITLHSAHWSTPFVEAMNEITRRRLPPGARDITYINPPKQYTVPQYETRITPYVAVRKFPEGGEKYEVHLPYCCFPAYRNDGKPSTANALKRDHPILKGIPAQFAIAHTEMYDEPFHVPDPDEVILEERWATGEWFRSAMLWKIGKGHVFYFRPGHETFPVYKEKWTLEILGNAVRWLGRES